MEERGVNPIPPQGNKGREEWGGRALPLLLILLLPLLMPRMVVEEFIVVWGGCG